MLIQLMLLGMALGNGLRNGQKALQACSLSGVTRSLDRVMPGAEGGADATWDGWPEHSPQGSTPKFRIIPPTGEDGEGGTWLDFLRLVAVCGNVSYKTLCCASISI